MRNPNLAVTARFVAVAAAAIAILFLATSAPLGGTTPAAEGAVTFDVPGHDGYGARCFEADCVQVVANAWCEATGRKGPSKGVADSRKIVVSCG